MKARGHKIFPIMTLWGLYVAMETRVLFWSGPKHNSANLILTHMMLQMKIHFQFLFNLYPHIYKSIDGFEFWSDPIID